MQHIKVCLIALILTTLVIPTVQAEDTLYDGMYDRPSYFPDFTQPTTWASTMSYFVYVRDADNNKLSNYEVAVYDQNNTLRTIGRSRQSQDDLCTLTIPGKRGDTFTFKVLFGDFDNPTIVDATTENAVTYKAYAVVGGPASPFWLTYTVDCITIGHDYQVKMVNGKPDFVWSADLSSAKLTVECSADASHHDDQDATVIKEVTTTPTSSTTGVLTCTAKVRYNNVDYMDVKTQEIPVTASTESINADIVVADNSWTVINTNVGSDASTPTITVVAGTAENPVTANIVLESTSALEAKVNVSVPANATLNIYGSAEGTAETPVIKGNITVAQGSTLNISGAIVEGKIEAADATVNIGGASISGMTVDNNKQVASSIVVRDETVSCPVNFSVSGSSVYMMREFTKNVTGTIMLGFTVPVSDIIGATIYEFTGVAADMSSMTMTSVTSGNLEAYKPYCVLPENSGKFTFTGEVEFKKTPKTVYKAVEGDWSFNAMNEEKMWAEGDSELGTIYGFAAEARGNIAAGTFVKAAAGASIKAGRCVLKYNGSSPNHAPGRAAKANVTLPATIAVHFVDGETTGIATLNTETGEMGPVRWYDLNGRKIERPTKSGVYIKNNKKVIVK